MSVGAIKLDKSDKVISICIRLGDKYCVRCGAMGSGKMAINGLQASHFYGRGKESTRVLMKKILTHCAPDVTKSGVQRIGKRIEFVK